jgi:ribosome-binding factor A
MQKCLSEIIKYKVKDPRISEIVSILSVSVSKDLKSAKVTVSIFGEEKDSSFAALKNTASYLRKELALEMKNVRTVPELSFVLDNSMEYSRHINSILSDLFPSDKSDSGEE